MPNFSMVLSSVLFFQGLLALDEKMALEVRAKGCPCGGRLHQSDYPRTILGVLERIVEFFEFRFSFCCDRDGCRMRRTPPSVRFLGRRRFAFALVLLASVLTNGVNARRIAQLQGLVPVSEATLQRWRKWWQKEFTITPLWQEMCGRFMPAILSQQLPDGILARSIIDGAEKRVTSILCQLSPLSTTSCSAF